ncbi:hypothetical protein [Lentzea sp.]|uniref:hypothetical protein n=1 Tax=Lentzea sp. TaxID=56099 RepID=UPI002CB6A998|nr:hypothetical protein [Lentzea sp.]HUQ58837.1 hypothetical protein [Lentzea sp.]
MWGKNLTTLARDTGTTAEAADALLGTLHEDLSMLPSSAQLDAVLCLLEAARPMLRALGRAPGELSGEDLDHIRAAMRAASLSVRTCLWQNGDG